MQVFDSYIDAGQDLPQRERERYYAALVEFVQYGKEPKLSGAANAVMTAIMPSLRISRKNAENGRKGGKRKAKRKAEALGDSLASETVSETQANGQANSNSNSNSSLEKPINKVFPKERNYPKTMKCPTCGKPSEHIGGGYYRCDTCEEFGMTFKGASC